MYDSLKKKFGQNFLIDKNILSKITNLISIEKLSILEIGPGNGNLTKKIISKKPAKLDLVEIDKDLIGNLENNFSKFNYINIYNEDILKININSKYDLVISNLPYNISSQIIVKLSSIRNRPTKLILMFQKEFALRLLDEKINSINSLIKCFYDIKLNFHVSRNCFRPVPKVDSSILTFDIKKSLIKNNELNEFIEFKRKLFSHKRKTLKNLLRGFRLDEQFNLSLRVEDIKLSELIAIFRATNS